MEHDHPYPHISQSAREWLVYGLRQDRAQSACKAANTSTTFFVARSGSSSYQGQWEPFEEWLAKARSWLPPSGETQDRWWAANGKTFRFMDLPAELRLKVYGKITGPYIRPHLQRLPYHHGNAVRTIWEPAHDRNN
jgi:hypothetical protein